MEEKREENDEGGKTGRKRGERELKRRGEKYRGGYIRCDYFIVTHFIIDYDVI